MKKKINTSLHCIALRCMLLYCSVLNCIALYFITWLWELGLGTTKFTNLILKAV